MILSLSKGHEEGARSVCCMEQGALKPITVSGFCANGKKVCHCVSFETGSPRRELIMPAEQGLWRVGSKNPPPLRMHLASHIVIPRLLIGGVQLAIALPLVSCSSQQRFL